MQGGEKILYKGLSFRLNGILFGVYNELGYGYQEKIYERAIEKCFKDENIIYRSQAPYRVLFRGECIGCNFFDFVVENKIVLELKKGNYFSKKNIEQVKGYLMVSGLKLAILANFTPSGVKLLRVLNPNNLIDTNSLHS